MLQLLCLPSVCDGCKVPLSIEYVCDCCIGGLVGKGHNKVHDAFGDPASLVCSPVIWELVVCDCTDSTSDVSFADLCVHALMVFGTHRPI